MKASQIKKLQLHIFEVNKAAKPEDQIVLMVTGAPGVGKTDIIKQAAIECCDMPIYKSHPSVEDPTDTKGLPWPNVEKDSATFLPTGIIATLLKEKSPCLWLIDDFGQAPQSVQVAYMQWLWGKELNGHKLPQGVNITLCTNRMSDMAAVFPIPEPVKSRVVIVELDFDLDDWCTWAIRSNLPYEFIAFARMRVGLFGEYKPSKELTNGMTPRTFTRAASLYSGNLPAELWFDSFAGTIGKGAGAELNAFLKIFKELPDIDGLLLDPMAQKVPKEPSVRYAITAAITKHVSPANIENAFIYLDRFENSDGVIEKDYGVMFAKALQNTADKQNCVKTTSFIKWAIEVHKYIN